MIFSNYSVLLFEPIVRESSLWLESWMLLPMMAILAMMAWVRVNYPQRIVQVAQAVVYDRRLKQTMREEYLLSHRASIVFLIMYIVVGGLLFYLLGRAIEVQLIEGHAFVLVISYSGLLSIVLLIRSMTIKLFQILSDGEFGLEEYHYHTFLSYMLTGLVWTPLVLISVFLSPARGQYFIYASLTILALVFLYRLIKGWIAGRSHGVTWHQLILYLCTLEILPLLVCAKLLSNLSGE